MGKRKPNPAVLPADFQNLNRLIPQELSLPSLREQPPRVRGHAFRFFLVLPLYDEEGRKVFADAHLAQLFSLFNTRFGGCLMTSSRSGAPFFGEYQPTGTQSVRDYHTIAIVYASPIEASNRFFEELKEILKRFPLIEQEEILVERSEIYLL